MLVDMTRSELHAVMTGGFATIAASVMAAFILFGVSFVLSTLSYLPLKCYILSFSEHTTALTEWLY